MNKTKLYRLFLYWWLIGFAWASIIQIFFSKIFAQNTVWGFSKYSKEDITFWFWGVIIIMVYVYKSYHSGIRSFLGALFTILGFFGIQILILTINNRNTYFYKPSYFMITLLFFAPLIIFQLALFLFENKKIRILQKMKKLHNN